MTISFNQIPVGIRTPGQYVEIDNSKALDGLPSIPRKLLVIGQKLTAGTVDELVPTAVTSAEQAETFFGRGSMLAQMFAALKVANRYTETIGIAIDELAGGTAATGDITFSGTVTAAGTLNLYIAGKAVKVSVAAAASMASIATAVAAAIQADTSLPVSAAVNGVDDTQVDLTAKWKGLTGNDIDLRVNYYTGEFLPAGLAVAFTAMASGAGNPDISEIVTVMGDIQYHDIIMPWTDAANLTALETELSDRFGPLRVIEGQAYAAARGTQSALTTLGNARNSPHVSILGANASPTPPWIWAAVYGAVVSYYADIDPARPFQTLALPGVLPPKETDEFTQSERNILLYDGISTFEVATGGVVRIERAITTYQKNAQDVADASYLDVNTMLTVAYLRASLRIRIALRYPRHKLANDGTNFGSGQAIATPRMIRGEIIALFREWEAAGLAENIDQFKGDLIVQRNESDPNRVDALVPPDIVNQLRVFAAQVQFRL